MHASVLRAALGSSILIALAASAPTPLMAQGTARIRGTVVDLATRAPLSDVQLVVIGTGLGAVTGINGSFLVENVPAGLRQIRIRRLAYAVVDTSVTLTAGEEARLDVALRSAPTVLSQVVVTGTPEPTEKRALGNGVSTLDVEELNSKSVNLSVTDLLQSKTPGVSILPGSGAPGTAGEIRIRGAASLTSYRPVVYIDGIRYNIDGIGNFNATGSGLAGQAQSSQATSALDFINPNDIESIEVLKGPAAATLYGAEAAGGVIQIITKKGTRGQQELRWTARVERGENEWALDPPTNYTTCDAARKADTTTWPGCKTVPLGTVLRNNPLRDDPTALREGDLQRLSLSVRGGGDKYSIYLSGDQDLDEGAFFNSSSKRRSVRSNFIFTPTEKADFSVNLGFIQTNLRLPYQDESANALLLSASRGKPGRISGDRWATVVPSRSNEYNNRTKSDQLILGGTFNYRPFEWFRSRFTAGLNSTTSLAQLLSEPGSLEDPAGFIAQRVPRTKTYTLDYSGSAVWSLPRALESTTSVGTQIIANRTERLDATGQGLGSPDVTIIGTATTTSGNNTFSENNSVGLYVQEVLGWNNRLFLTGAVRADDHSAFGENFDVIIYPKASLAWVLTEEPAAQRFFDAIRADEFKFRTAWGRAGRAPSPYSAVQTYTIDKTSFATLSVPFLRTSAFGNPNLKPERGEEIEVGFDAAFLDQRMGADFTFYHKRTTDMLLNVPLPPSKGFAGSELRNLGEVTNSGIELGLTGTPVRMPRFAWETRVNLSTNKNRLVSFGTPGKTSETLGGQPFGVVQQHREGFPLGGYWARLPLRNPDGSPQLSPTGTVLLDTATFLGSSSPTREIGFSNTFTLFKNFRVYALLDYKGGQFLFNAKESNRCISNDNCERVNDPRLRNPQTASDSVLARELPVLRQVPAVYIEDADFVKLRDVSLSYSVPTSWLSRVRAEGATLTITGKNLALWSDYSGIDPEVNSYGGRLFSRADVYASPMTRRVSLSLTVNY